MLMFSDMLADGVGRQFRQRFTLVRSSAPPRAPYR
jgi:hypothetical protein